MDSTRVEDPKSCIMQKTQFFAHKRYMAGFLYTDSLNSAWNETIVLQWEACQGIQHAFSKPSLVNLISKDANLVFYLSIVEHSSNYDIIFNFCVDSASLATSIKKCNVIMTW